MRKKKWVDPFMQQEHRQLLKTPEDFKQLNKEEKEVYLEIGCGLGDFILGTATDHPEHLYIAMERDISCVAKCVRSAEELGLENVYFIRADAQNLNEWFEGIKFSGMYLLFSDPWHKKPHYKRRLTYRKFLENYAEILKPNGFLYFKTDNRNLFEFTVEELKVSAFAPEKVSLDFHAEFESGHMTMYEQKFKKQGMPIYHIFSRLSSKSRSED